MHIQIWKSKNKSILYSTIRNLFYDQCRRKKIINFESISDQSASTLSEDPVNSADKMDLENALSKLKANEREVIYLHAVEGHTAKEISEMTGSPRNTILSLIHRSRKKLLQLCNMKGKADQKSLSEENL